MKIDAVEKAYTSFFHAIRNGQIEIVKTMIGNGFDVKSMRQVIRLRKLDRDDRQEQEELLQLYQHAIGMA